MEDFFSIKELGDLFGVSVQTLQYYDRIGLFPPTRRNEHNGYRMYKFDSVYGLATICYLKKLECSLEDIREYLEGRDHNDAIVSLKNAPDNSTGIIRS